MSGPLVFNVVVYVDAPAVVRGRHNLDLAFDYIPVVFIARDGVGDTFALSKTIEDFAFRIILDKGINSRVLKLHVAASLAVTAESVIGCIIDTLVGNVYAQNAQMSDERQYFSINVEDCAWVIRSLYGCALNTCVSRGFHAKGIFYLHVKQTGSLN